LLVGGARGRGSGGFFKDLLQVQAVEFIEFGEAAIPGLVGRKGIALEPAIAALSIEILAGVHGLVDERRIKDAQRRLGARRGSLAGGRHRGKNAEESEKRKMR
jgi:hypothetical protein